MCQRNVPFTFWLHTGVHFFDISTSESGPSVVCFSHVDFDMRFAPQPRALFRHLNFQKCSDTKVFLAFWLRNLLRATTACSCSSLISPDGSKPAALASLLFDPPEPQNIEKKKNATFLPFRAPAPSFFWPSFFLTFSSLIFFLLTLSALTLPTSAFPSADIVGSLTSKHPSNIATSHNNHNRCPNVAHHPG